MHPLRCLFFWLSPVLLFAPDLRAASDTPVYKWKPNEVLRFDYEKTVSISAPAPLDKSGAPVLPPDPLARKFKFNAVLIIEINKTRTEPLQTAVLRFDSPRVEIPESFWFSSQSDEVALLKDRDKSIERAIEGAVKAARWNVALGTDGSVRIDGRTPAAPEDWLREVDHAAMWRSKFRKAWIEIVEKNLGLGSTGDDHDIFLTLAPKQPLPPFAPMPLNPELDKIRPVRSATQCAPIKDQKSELSFSRMAPPRAGQPYDIPTLGSIGIAMTFNPQMSPIKGACLFDCFIGLPDFISEEYAFKLDFRCVEDASHIHKHAEEVLVKYDLKRLAPKIDTYEQPIELPVVK